MIRLIRKLALAACGAALVVAGAAHASDWSPSGPITLKVGFGPGGSTDALARAVAETIEKEKGWKVIVENVEGGGGLNMLAGMVNAKPDGQTIGFGVSVPVWINLQRRGDQLPFKIDSFDWLGTVGRAPLVIAIKNDLAAQDFASLVEMAKRERVTVATNGPAQEMIVQAIAKATGADFVPVPTKSGSEMVQNLLGGHIKAATLGGEHAQYVKSGDMRVLLSLSPVRDGAVPEAPTLQEAGYPFYVDAAFYFAAPAGLSPEARDALASAIGSALKGEAISRVATNMSLNVDNLGPDGTTRLMNEGMASVGEMLKAIGN